MSYASCDVIFCVKVTTSQYHSRQFVSKCERKIKEKCFSSSIYYMQNKILLFNVFVLFLVKESLRLQLNYLEK